MSALDTLLGAPLQENKQGTSMAKASTPEPVGPGPLWHTPGLRLPPYIEHVANDLKGTESERVRKATGIVRNWSEGHDGNGHKVTPDTQAAAVKAMAEYEAARAKAHAHSAAKAASSNGKVRESLSISASLALAGEVERRLSTVREAVGDDAFRGFVLLVEADESGPTMLKCPKCDAKQRASNDTCSNCGHSLTAARKAKMARLNEAASGSFSPELGRVASAPNEVERHEVVDDGQTVGTIARRRAYSPADPDRFSVSAVNGSSVGDFNLRSRADALTALRKHLEEAPARVQPYRDGKYLVASPARYNGGTTYTEFPNEPTARHAAGLPAQPSTPERQSKVDAVAEMVTLDLLALGGYAPERLAEWRELMPRVPEGALLVPLSD